MSSEHSTDDEADDDRTTIRQGRNFEEEYRLDAAEAGTFLVDLGEQLQDGEELTISDEEWELPFAVGEPVTLEIDYEGMGEPELECPDEPTRTHPPSSKIHWTASRAVHAVPRCLDHARVSRL